MEVALARKDDPTGIKTPRELGGTTVGIYVSVKDVDAHYAREGGRRERSHWSCATWNTGRGNTRRRIPRATTGVYGTYAPNG